MNEEWKEISGYEGLYLVSDKGRIRNVEHKILRVDGISRTIKERIINQIKNNRGYLRVRLYKNRNKKSCLVHRIVLIAFLGIDKDNKETNHKDGNKENNYIENLEWSNRSENLKHAYRTGLKKPWRKKCH